MLKLLKSDLQVAPFFVFGPLDHVSMELATWVGLLLLYELASLGRAPIKLDALAGFLYIRR